MRTFDVDHITRNNRIKTRIALVTAVRNYELNHSTLGGFRKFAYKGPVHTYTIHAKLTEACRQTPPRTTL